jgi:dTDP-4-dehydrorhamnose reductase
MGRILLLGGRGQIGALLARAFPADDLRVVGRPEADLLDRASLDAAVRAHDPDAVVCAAGIADADRCEDRPEEAYAVNVDGARRAAEASRGRHFTIFSTDHVFDGREGPYAEDDRPGPLSVYGRTKLEMERVVLTVHPESLVVRTSLVFSRADRSFFARLIRTADPLPCWTDQFGTPTWGPMLAEAVVELVASRRRGLIHVAGAERLSRHAFALKVARRFGLDPARFRPCLLREAPPRAPRPLSAGLRTELARAELRTKILTLDEALEVAYRAHGSP